MSTIYIDGMDCSGKSTVVKLLKEWGAIDIARQKTLSDYNPLLCSFKDMRAKFSWDSDEVSYALLSAILYDINHAIRYDETQRILQESILITKGYCMLVSGGRKNQTVLEYFEKAFQLYPKFDYSFFVTVNKQERLERLKKRINKHEATLTKNDRLILENYEIFEKRNMSMQEVMTKRFHAIVIDSSEKIPEQVAKIIASHTNPPV